MKWAARGVTGGLKEDFHVGRQGDSVELPLTITTSHDTHARPTHEFKVLRQKRDVALPQETPICPPPICAIPRSGKMPFDPTSFSLAP